MKLPLRIILLINVHKHNFITLHIFKHKIKAHFVTYDLMADPKILQNNMIQK